MGMVRGRGFWKKLSAAYERGDGTIEELAARHGVVASTFRFWRWKLRRETPAAKPGKAAGLSRRAGAPKFVAVRVRAPAPAEATGGSAAIEIALGNGRVVRVVGRFEPALLARVLDVASASAGVGSAGAAC